MVSAGFKEVINTRVNAITNIELLIDTLNMWHDIAEERERDNAGSELIEKAWYRVQTLARRYEELTA